MKKTLFRILLIHVAILTFGLNTFAQDVFQSGLPEGAKVRLGKGRIFDAAYSPDGKLLAVASSIGVWLYDAETGEALDLLTMYAAAYVRNIYFSPNGQILLSRDSNGSAVVWDAVTREYLHHLASDRWGIYRDAVTREYLHRLGRGGYDISFSPDGRTVAIASSGDGWGSIRFYDVTTGKHLRTIEDELTAERNDRLNLQGLTTIHLGIYGGVGSLSFSPDGKTLASGHSDGNIRFWSVDTGELLQTVAAHVSGIEKISFHPDGKTLASSGRLDGTIQIWDVNTGELLHTLTGHTGWIYNFSFSPDGKTLASASHDETIRIWNATTGEHLQTLTGHTGTVYSVSFHPNGRTIASVSEDATLRIWNATTGAFLHTLARHTGWIESVSFHPDGRTLASGGQDKTLRIWNVDTNELLHTLTGHTGSVNTVAFHPDGQMLASGSSDHSIRFWDPDTGDPLRTLTGHIGPVSNVAFNPDGRTLASGSADGSIRIWDVRTGEPLHILIARATEVTCVAFNPDGRTLASGNREGTVNIWNVGPGKYLHPMGDAYPVYSIAFSPASTNLPMAFRPVYLVNSIAFSPDGQSLAIVGGRWSDQIRIWDVSTDEQLLSITSHSNSMAFSPDGRMLASGGAYDTSVWDAATGERLHRLSYWPALVNSGYTRQAHSISFSPDGRTLASGIEDGTVLLWEITPAPVAEERIPEDVNADGNVNIQDLVLVAANLGETGQNTADVNGDGTVNVLDLTRVAGALGTAAGAPSDWERNLAFTPTRKQVSEWLEQARQMNITDPTFQRGFLMLERLLASLTPKETVLLPNYPNPFNPETWIPYQLSEPVAVDITIYSADGQLVRRLSFGYQPAGRYESRSRAAYWDGRNETGELVASGLYFYTLTAGEFSETRKMLIRK